MLIILVPIIVLLLYYYTLKPQLYWRNKNVKQSMPIPLLGDNLRATFRIESFTDMIKRLYNKYENDRYFGIYQMVMPTLVIRDPQLIKQITVKEFDHFLDHFNFASEEYEPLWNRNLFSLRGEKWREMRATLSPSFTASKMRAMFGLMEKTAEQYAQFYLDQNKDIIELELKNSFSRFANDVIANCAFGIQVNSLKDPENEFYTCGKTLTNLTGFRNVLKFILIIIAPKLMEKLNLPLFDRKSGEFFKTLVHDTVKYREEKNIVRPDMVHLMMEARKGQLKYEECHDQKDSGFATVEESQVGKTSQPRKVEMSELDMAAQMMIFFFAGFDTISSVLSFLCYELAVNPDIQEKLRQEVIDTLEKMDGKLTYDSLNKMKYMDMVLCESLRKHPAVIATDRICTMPFTIQSEREGETAVTLEPKTVIWIPVMGLHYDEKYFANPHKFDPERFSDENKANIQPYTYLPFGSGPRNCIGSRFALMEIKTLFVHILNKFEITVTKKTTIPVEYDKGNFNPALKGGFWVGFKRLNFEEDK